MGKVKFSFFVLNTVSTTFTSKQSLSFRGLEETWTSRGDGTPPGSGRSESVILRRVT